jgi:hypothetical protein
MWISSLPLKAGQSFRTAASSWHNPDVVCVRESNLICADGWRAQQPCLRTAVSILRERNDWKQRDKNNQQKQQTKVFVADVDRETATRHGVVSSKLTQMPELYNDQIVFC